MVQQSYGLQLTVPRWNNRETAETNPNEPQYFYLQQYPCILSNCSPLGEPGGYAIWRLQREREVREVQVTARVAVPDPSIHHQLALRGVGVAMLGQAAVGEDFKERRLVRLVPDWEPEPIELYALHPSQLAASPKVRVLLEFSPQRL